MGSLWRIFFDPANAAETATVGAYLIDAAGALLSSTLIGSKQRLDVNTASEYAEDSASADGDFGSFILGVRNDTNAALTSADGDYGAFAIDSAGRLKVVADLTVTSDFVYPEDSASADGDEGAFVLAVRQDTLATSTSNDGDYAAFKTTALGEIYVADPTVRTTLASLLTELQSVTYAEDSASTNADPGVFVLGVRNDTNATLTSADGDYGALAIDSAGRVKIVGTITLGGQYAEDSPHTSGDIGLFTMAVRHDANSSMVSTDGDYAPFQVTAVGDLKVSDRNNGVTKQQLITVTSTAAAIPAAPLADRKRIIIQNIGSRKMYLGSSTVTSSGATQGLEVAVNGYYELPLGPANILYAVTATGTCDIIVWELS